MYLCFIELILPQRIDLTSIYQQYQEKMHANSRILIYMNEAFIVIEADGYLGATDFNHRAMHFVLFLLRLDP